MTKGERTGLVWSVRIGSIAWMAVLGFLLFVTYGVEPANHGSNEVKDRMAAECIGTFKDRYGCKEAIIVKSGQETFVAMAWRFLLVIVPPMVVNFWLPSYLRRNPVHAAEHHHEAAADWKSRAQFHTQKQSPEEAAQDLHVDGLPSVHHPAHHTIDDIAPVPDWKAKAQSQISKAKRPE
ncbi:hypothetical protein [Magnetospirillum sp. 64-120]|uniref:hypothetical protein n=1 Tax=Magnetospirillum sp. 64-120 TaxID=1895778 RepID=UPI0009270CFD|nr:hypothetical protein [Magnetospirillum sp. 64-120]OJX68242.1 MAG: hypothetical protein BGO92_06220 [Magnetospirillum sp. 64-120]